MILIQTIRH